MAAPNVADLAQAPILTAPSPADSGTTLILYAGYGLRMPTAPFYATAAPSGALPTLENAEIVQVTDVTSDTLTIVRAQRGTSAMTIEAGWVIYNGIYASDVTGAYDRANHTGTQLAATISDLSTVATTGAYSDLTGSPTIPDELADLSEDSTHRIVTDTEKSTWNGKQDALGYTPENAIGRVSAFQVTPDNLHYPSEKLVKDQLDAKASSAHTHTESDITDLGTYQNVLAEGAFADGDKTKLDGIATGAEVNVQSDWTQATNTADDYIKNKPTLGTAAAKDIPATGNASATEVVYGTDTRLTDSRPASDVSAWAKTPTKPTYTNTEVGAAATVHTHAISDTTGLQTSLDGKVDENAAITGATKTKITYDAKGLVTAGVDATTADIADSTDKRYISDAQRTVLSNTSGTNTGDQDLSTYQLKPTEGAFANGDKTKLDGIEALADVTANATVDGGAY